MNDVQRCLENAERCLRLARQMTDPKEAQGLITLAAAYAAQGKQPTLVPSPLKALPELSHS